MELMTFEVFYDSVAVYIDEARRRIIRPNPLTLSPIPKMTFSFSNSSSKINQDQ